MSIQKLPFLGSVFAKLLPVAGQTGAAALTPFAVVAAAACEVTIARFKLSGAAIVLDGTNATVTLASHLNTRVGQQVTFSGATGVTAINDQTWTISKITSTSVYVFPCKLTGTVAGTIVQEPVFTLPQGLNICRMDANANIEYNSDSLYNSANGSTTAPTWKIYIVGNGTPVVGMIASDGFGVRMRCMGTTASSYFNNFA